MQLLTNEYKGILYAIGSGLSFGLLGYFGITLMQAHLSVYNMLFWRFVIGAITVGFVLIPHYATLFKEPKEAIRVIIYGVLFYSTTTILYFLACQYISTGLAMVTFFTYPVVVLLLNRIFYKTSIPRSYYLAVFLIVMGMVLLGGNDTVTCDYRGLLLGIASAVVYAWYIILSKKSTLSPVASTFMVSIGCIMSCCIAAVWEGSFCIPQGFDVWMKILALGTLCTALPMLLLLKALKYISSEKASLLSVLEPIFTLFFGVILLDETVTMVQMIGIVIILCGALVTVLSSSAKKSSVNH